MSESVVIIERISDPFNQPARCISISYVKLTSSGGLSMDDIGLGSPDQTFLAFGEGGFEVPHSGNTFCPFHLERLVTKTAKGPVMTVVEAGDALVAERRRLRRADHYIQQRCPKKHVPDPSTTMIHARTYVPLTFSLPAPTENKNNVVPVPKASQASSCFHDDECATATTKASNVPGPAFINVHRTLDPYADVVRAIETSVVAVSYDGGGCLDMETLGIGEPDDMFVAFDLNNKLRPGPYFPNGRYMYCIFDHVRYEHEDDLNPTLIVISHDDLIVAQEHHYQERKARERALKREARSKWLASIAPWAIFATSHGAEHEAKPRFASLPVTEDSSTAEHQGY